jgi:hypothetical protein
VTKHRLPCPCCGSKVLREGGAFEICPVCGWEDDPSQSDDPELDGGANPISLSDARAAWQARATRP